MNNNWKPRPGEIIEVSDDRKKWVKEQFFGLVKSPELPITTYDPVSDTVCRWDYMRPVYATRHNKKKIVYIAHPISGNVQENLNRVRMIYTAIARECPEIVPFAPYWITCHALDDSNFRDRKIGFKHNKAIFHSGIIDEVWVYGDSPGVRREIEWAKELGIKVVNKDF